MGDGVAHTSIDPDVDVLLRLPGDGEAGARRPKALRGPQALLVGALAVGGALGAVSRYAIALAMPTPPNGFPWATLVINLTGSAALGLVLVLLAERFPRRRLLRMTIGTGFIGAYTTFSTFTVEAVTLARQGRLPVAATYVGVTLVGGLLAVWAGITLARILIKLRPLRRQGP